jgi:hypothetical protein
LELQVWFGLQLSLYWQVPLTQLAVLFDMSAQLPALQHSWQTPLQSFRLPPHFRPHFEPSQVAEAFAPVGHGEHDEVPHELTLLLSTHASPQRWNPDRQVKSQVVPSQVALPFACGSQGLHEAPQLAVSLLGTQLPLQLWVPSGQVPSHAFPFAWQMPLHKVVSAGHSEPHLVPSQVALPPDGIGQGEQPMPQLIGSLLAAQDEPHAW